MRTTSIFGLYGQKPARRSLRGLLSVSPWRVLRADMAVILNLPYVSLGWNYVWSLLPRQMTKWCNPLTWLCKTLHAKDSNNG
eukprot:12283099-Karenia_brevis.AAC.1